ncbi:Sec23/Sec24 zinc finger [Fragilaria crotonensis]|nr:Sec23/Sec24 zinc finger [Fragilaria crotonensis]
MGTPNEIKLLKPEIPWYKDTAIEFSRQQISVDMFLFPYQYMDVSALSELPRYTAGALFSYVGFNPEKDGPLFESELHKRLTQTTAFEAVMRIRCTKGMRITNFYGKFLLAGVAELCPGIPRRLQELLQTEGDVASGDTEIPENLELLPVYTLAMMKNVAFRGGTDVHPDERICAQYTLNSMWVDQSRDFMYPRMFSIHDMDSSAGLPFEGNPDESDIQLAGRDGIVLPQVVNLTCERLRPDGIFLLDNGVVMNLWVGSSADPHILESIFGVRSLGNVDMRQVSVNLTGDDFANRFGSIALGLRELEGESHVISPKIEIVREGDPHVEARFFWNLIEDRASFQGGTYNYSEFMDFIKNPQLAGAPPAPGMSHGYPGGPPGRGPPPPGPPGQPHSYGGAQMSRMVRLHLVGLEIMDHPRLDPHILHTDNHRLRWADHHLQCHLPTLGQEECLHIQLLPGSRRTANNLILNEDLLRLREVTEPLLRLREVTEPLLRHIREARDHHLLPREATEPPPPHGSQGPPPPPQGSYGAPPPPPGSYGALPPPQGRYGAPPQAQGQGPPPAPGSYGAQPPPQNRPMPPPPGGSYGAPPPQGRPAGGMPPPPPMGGARPPPPPPQYR